MTKVTPEARLVAARSQLHDAERRLVAACEVRNVALRAASFAERDLREALAMRNRHVGDLPMSGPAPKPPNVSAARDAYATANARLKAAERAVREAQKEKQEADKEIAAAREAFANGGDWRSAAAAWHAEASRLEQAAREARAEAIYAEQMFNERQSLNGLSLHELNRRVAELQRQSAAEQERLAAAGKQK